MSETDDLTPTPPKFDTEGWMSDVNEELTSVEERLATQEQRSKLMMIGMGLCAFGVVATGRITMQVLKMVQQINATLQSSVPTQIVQEAKEKVAAETPTVVPEEDLPPLRTLSDEEAEALKNMDPAIIKDPGPTP